VVIRDGKPYVAILDWQNKKRAISSSSACADGWRSMLFGSTTNQVVRQASCPDLTLKQ